ncbi:MAG: hypothetical protein QOJ42_66 [Acidobacteriaceae bacterium]|nr:hypothetical protein [Acidobacteriaceae bacterium]
MFCFYDLLPAEAITEMPTRAMPTPKRAVPTPQIIT